MIDDDSRRRDAYEELIEGLALHLDPHFPPPSANVHAEFGARTLRSRRRDINEDHYVVFRLSRHQDTLLSSLQDESVTRGFVENGYAIAVADGMGGAGNGELASRLALVTLLHLVRHFGRWNLRVDDKIAREIVDRAKRFYRHVDNAVAQRSATSDVRLQTTLTAVFGAGRDLFFAHVGHSRAYLFRDGQLMRLTRDHTLAQAMQLPLAPLVAVNDSVRDLRHVLTDTIGKTGSVGPQIDLERFQLFDHDTILVCTNGLTDLVPEYEIAAVLGNGELPDRQCETLIEHARASAAADDDDATAVIAHYRVPPGM